MAVPLFATKFLKYFSRNFPKYFSRKFQNISPEIMRGRIYGLTKLHNHRQSLKFLFSNILKTSWVMSFYSWLNSTFWFVFPLRNLFLFLSCFVCFLSNSCFLDAITSPRIVYNQQNRCWTGIIGRILPGVKWAQFFSLGDYPAPAPPRVYY